MISLLQFQCTAISTPPRVFTDFKKIVTEFIWNGTTSKVAYNVMIQDLSYGGLKVPHLWARVQVIHIKWVKYMWVRQECLLSLLLRDSMSFPDIRSVLLCKYNLVSKVDTRYSMLSDILKTWHEVHRFNPTTETDIQQEPLLYNDNITMNKSPLFWKISFG